MIEDLRYTLRQFRKSPGFASAAIVTLALGIGAAAAMFVLIQGVLLSPPPYEDPDRLVFISSSRQDRQPYTQGSTIGQWIDWRTSSRTLEPPALYRWTFNFLVLPDGSRSMGGMVVTSGFFKTLGLKPILGREPVDTEASRPKVPASAIVIGHNLWERQYNRDPNIVGKTLQLSRYPTSLPIVGVMPPGVRFLPDPGGAAEPNYDVNAPVDFWLMTVPDETQPRSRGWNAVTRLGAGATLQEAQAEVTTLASRQVEADTRLAALTVNVRPVLEDLNREGRSLLLPLFGFVVLVFFVACVNVTGLFVARGLQRHREYAMRAAIGASRSRLFRQTITESVALSMLSAVIGAAFAIGIVTVFLAIGDRAIPRADAVTMGWPVIAFGFVAGLLAALVSGVLPAVRAASPGHADTLKGMRASTGRAERRLLSAIATVQIVLTVALLTGAALLIRTTVKLASVRPGYDVQNIMAVTVTTVTPNSFLPFHTQVLERVSALPGVSKAAFAWGVPLTGNKWPGQMEFIARPELGQVGFALRSITQDYFGVMGIAMVAGRMFTADDKGDSRPVMVINQTMAARYFKDVDPLGQQMRFAGDMKRQIEIVGVVTDTRTEALSRQVEPEIYFPFWQNGAFSKHLVVRAQSDPAALVALVRREIHAVDPTASVERATTMEEIRRESLAPRTFAMRLLFGFSIVATALALVGIYGVLSLSVGSRLKEIAVRKAIGAQQRDILRSVLGEGGRMILIGVGAGAVVAALVGRALDALLFEVASADAISVGAAALTFGIVALGTCLLPAVRAARADLLAALRQE
ncbi:MAG: ADOP family duplicated permease [Vicinamibacterales bacterium]